MTRRGEGITKMGGGRNDVEDERLKSKKLKIIRKGRGKGRNDNPSFVILEGAIATEGSTWCLMDDEILPLHFVQGFGSLAQE